MKVKEVSIKNQSLAVSRLKVMMIRSEVKIGKKEFNISTLYSQTLRIPKTYQKARDRRISKILTFTRHIIYYNLGTVTSLLYIT